MDGFNEKKWFVYLSDHHEGPFSLSEIQAKMAESQVTRSNFVWAEGMADWLSMTQVAEFEAILTDSSPATPPPMTEPLIVPTQEERTKDLDPSDLKLATSTPSSGVKVHSGTPPVQAKRSFGRIFKWAAVILIPAGLGGAYVQGYLDPVIHSPALKAGIQTFSDFAQPYLVLIPEKIPALAKWISPIRTLEDVTSLEYEGLKIAALQKMDAGGPKIAVAVSGADLLAPTFYVSSNLPDGAVIDLYIEGISETLLNQLSFNAKTQAIIERKLGQTAAVKFTDGKPLPRGEYVVYATEGVQKSEAVSNLLANIPPVTAKMPPTLPRGLKLLVSKTYFLGGNKDATYESRLKDFHDKLRAKAATEMGEIKQFAMTLDSQLTSTASKFARLRSSSRKSKPAPALRKTWDTFNTQWTQLNDQLKQSYVKWTPEALQSEYFYGILYLLTAQAGQAVEQVHRVHQGYFEGKIDSRALDIQLGTAMSSAQNAVSALKGKVEQAEKIAPSINGMPRREGL